ncbi:unnamed protein product [Lasius platythorax]|uniref:Uncharacterized protein n=1 Tax=Lasius platythorax TaxID=488582 RepID=A0AAV2P302_9HYME
MRLSRSSCRPRPTKQLMSTDAPDWSVYGKTLETPICYWRCDSRAVSESGSHLDANKSMPDTQNGQMAAQWRPPEKRDIWKFPSPSPVLASRHRTHGNLLEVLDGIRVF